MDAHLHFFSEEIITTRLFLTMKGGLTKDVPQDEKFLNEHGLEKP